MCASPRATEGWQEKLEREKEYEYDMGERENTPALFSHERGWRASLRDGKLSSVAREGERDRWEG